jgi:hypothetical protein
LRFLRIRSIPRWISPRNRPTPSLPKKKPIAAKGAQPRKAFGNILGHIAYGESELRHMFSVTGERISPCPGSRWQICPSICSPRRRRLWGQAT